MQEAGTCGHFSLTDFPLRKDKQTKNLVLKHWILPIDHFGSWSEGCVKPLKLCREAI